MRSEASQDTTVKDNYTTSDRDWSEVSEVSYIRDYVNSSNIITTKLCNCPKKTFFCEFAWNPERLQILNS